MSVRASRRKATAEKPRAISLAILPSLLKQIDAIAAAESRSRASQINVFLDRAVRDYRAAARGAA
jgi:hypothetical protein